MADKRLTWEVAFEPYWTTAVTMFTLASKRSMLRQPKQDGGIDAMRLVLKKRAMRGNPQG